MGHLITCFNMGHSDEMTLRLTCGLVTDLCNSCGEQMTPFLDKLIPALQNVLNGDQFESETKLFAITAIGDLCMATGAQFMNYLQATFSSLMEASKTSLNKSDDPEENLIFTKLREALIEAYLSLLHGITDTNNIE